MKKQNKTNINYKKEKSIVYRILRTEYPFTPMLKVTIALALFVIAAAFIMGVGVTVDNGALNVSGNLLVNSNALFVDSQSNLVGIGTSSPKYEMSIVGNPANFPAYYLEGNRPRLILNNTMSSDGTVELRAWDDAIGFTLFGNIQSGFDHDDTIGNTDNSARTGVFWRTSNQGGMDANSYQELGFLPAGTGGTALTVLKINAAGNVGIGTTSPATPLHVKGGSSDILKIESSGASSNLIFTTSNGQVMEATGNENFNQFNSPVAGQGIRFITQGIATRGINILSSGNVGIGTTGPATLLHVNSIASDVATIQSTGSTANLLVRTSNGQGEIISETSGATYGIRLNFPTVSLSGDLYVDSSGNVGIGTTSPARKLHINDVMRLDARSSPPDAATIGDIYVDSDSKEICFYDGATWTGLKAGGACA